jgi:hypothetical protein
MNPGGSYIELNFKQTSTHGAATSGGGFINLGYFPNPNSVYAPTGGAAIETLLTLDERGTFIAGGKVADSGGFKGGLYIAGVHDDAALWTTDSARFYYDTTYNSTGGVTLEKDFATKGLWLSYDLTLGHSGYISYTGTYGGSIYMSKTLELQGDLRASGGVYAPWISGTGVGASGYYYWNGSTWLGPYKQTVIQYKNHAGVDSYMNVLAN